jgi:hypothetical protein
MMLFYVSPEEWTPNTYNDTLPSPLLPPSAGNTSVHQPDPHINPAGSSGPSLTNTHTIAVIFLSVVLIVAFMVVVVAYQWERIERTLLHLLTPVHRRAVAYGPVMEMQSTATTSASKSSKDGMMLAFLMAWHHRLGGGTGRMSNANGELIVSPKSDTPSQVDKTATHEALPIKDDPSSVAGGKDSELTTKPQSQPPTDSGVISGMIDIPCDLVDIDIGNNNNNERKSPKPVTDSASISLSSISYSCNDSPSYLCAAHDHYFHASLYDPRTLFIIRDFLFGVPMPAIPTPTPTPTAVSLPLSTSVCDQQQQLLQQQQRHKPSSSISECDAIPSLSSTPHCRDHHPAVNPSPLSSIT